MRPTLSSLTALLVSGARGIPREAHGDPADPFALQMLPVPLGLVARALTRVVGRDRRLARLVPSLSLGLVDHVSLRTLAIDEEVERAVAEGARQLVVLGAGFDTRVHRLGCLHGVRAFEVDHPATASVKSERARRLPLQAASLTRVALDFEHDDLDAALGRAGHDPAVPTVWVWEGVTMYLTSSAIEATLQHVQRRSATGSTLVLTYGPPDFAAPVYHALLWLAAEPLRTLFTPAQVAALLLRHGFSLHRDDGSADWLARAGRVGGLVVARERLAVGTR